MDYKNKYSIHDYKITFSAFDEFSDGCSISSFCNEFSILFIEVEIEWSDISLE